MVRMLACTTPGPTSVLPLLFKWWFANTTEMKTWHASFSRARLRSPSTCLNCTYLGTLFYFSSGRLKKQQ